jgi:hypothetical protein
MQQIKARLMNRPLASGRCIGGRSTIAGLLHPPARAQPVPASSPDRANKSLIRQIFSLFRLAGIGVQAIENAAGIDALPRQKAEKSKIP